MTKVLAFDTGGTRCAACLLIDGSPAIRVDEMAKGQAEHLMPMLAEMLEDAGLAWADLDAIGVGTGPGNFTGIRISVSAARGLALGLGIPAVGVTHLEAQAHGLPRPIVALYPAPRGQVYAQRFAEAAEVVRQLPTDDPVVLDAPAPIGAEALILHMAQIATDRFATTIQRPTPFYVRPADAAPPRDQAPAILA